MVVLEDWATSPFFMMNMYIPDYDDFYSLTEYASRFVKEPERYINLWVSQVSVISRIELLEKRVGNDFLKKNNASNIIKQIESDEILSIEYVIEELGLSTIVVEDGNVLAYLDVYYDFVGFLVKSGVV